MLSKIGFLELNEEDDERGEEMKQTNDSLSETVPEICHGKKDGGMLIA